MKKIFRNLKFGLMLCAGMFAASCSDVDEVMDEIPYTRVLTPLNFDADVIASAGTDVKFSWSTVSNAESYILEVFEAVVTTDTDENGKEVEIVSAPDYDNTIPAYTVELTNDDVPYTMKDLEVDKSFYARVRAVSSKIESSHWAYLTDYVTTSAVRAPLNPFVIERTATSVTIGWDDAEDKDDLTSVRFEPVVPVEGVTAVVMALSDAEKSECKVLVENLDVCTNYKFTLLFGKSGGRGVVTAWTRPDTEGTTRIASAEALYNAINGATGEVKLLLAYNDGAMYDLTPYHAIVNDAYDPIALTSSLSLYGEATAKGEKPVVRAAFKTAATESLLHFEDIVLDGGKIHGATVTTGGTMTDAEFVNCELYDYTKGIWSGAAGCNVETLSFDGVYAHDINATGSVGGDFIDIRGGDYGKIQVKNSTFYACARTFLRFSDQVMSVNDVNVENCTFNQVTATVGSSNNAGIFHIRHLSGANVQATINGTFTMTKCVFLNEFNDAESESSYWCRLTRQSAENYAPICAGNIYYNVGHAYSSIVSDDCHSTFFYNLKSLNTDGDAMTEALALADGGMILEDDPCTNSIAGKMYLTNGVISANRAGDPRWWNAAEPIVVRPTEIETVTVPTVWNFTEKTKFQTETVETNQIIENIRIYAPAEIVMGEGISFASAATVDSKGVPQNNALQFRAQGVGAVEVTTLDGGVNSSVQVVVGADRYVLLADGETHKVVLGDLVGENDIYVLAGSAVTVTSVAWTDDLTPENTVEALAAPKVAIDNTSFDEGTNVAVTASWSAVENAASYEVTFQGKKSEVTETSFVIDAATVAALPVGEYEISVVAKPVSTSSKYVASEAGVASFKVKKVILAGVTTVLWDFNDASFDTAAASIGTSDNTAADATYTVGGVDLRIQSLGGSMKVEERSEGRRLRTGGAGKTTSRAIWFKVPKTTESATLKINGTNPSSSTTDETILNFLAVNKDNQSYGIADHQGTGYKSVTVFEGIELTEGDEIYITCSGGYRYAYIEFSYADPDAGPVLKEMVWDCTDSSFDAIGEAMGTDGSLAATIPDLVWDGMTILTGSKTKYGTSTVNDQSVRYIQWGGKGDANKDRSCYFTAPASGKLTVVASNTGNSEDTSRLVAVSVNGEVTTQVGGTPTSAPTTCTFDIDIDEPTEVYIYPSGNGLRFYSMKFEYYE